MATLSAGESASRSERHRDGKPKGFFARALAHLFFRKNAALANHAFEDTPPGSDPWANSYRAQQQALSRKRSSHTGLDSSKARIEPVLEDDARFAPAVRYEVTIAMPLGSR